MQLDWEDLCRGKSSTMCWRRVSFSPEKHSRGHWGRANPGLILDIWVFHNHHVPNLNTLFSFYFPETSFLYQLSPFLLLILEFIYREEKWLIDKSMAAKLSSLAGWFRSKFGSWTLMFPSEKEGNLWQYRQFWLLLQKEQMRLRLEKK